MSRIRLRWRAAGVVAAFMVLAGVLIQGADAQKVLTPGPISIEPVAGFIALGDQVVDLTPPTAPECSDGIDNDGDGKADLADGGCVSADDDNEAVAGLQALQNLEFNGTVDGSGQIRIPTGGITFPITYIPIEVLGNKGVVTVKIIPTADVVGVLDPISGATSLQIRVIASVTGTSNLGLGSKCAVGTSASPIVLNLTSGISQAPGGTPAAGKAYNPAFGSFTVVSRDFAVPGASGCPVNPLVNANALINSQLGLPAPAGVGMASLVASVDPLVERGIIPRIGASPGTSGPAPFTVDLDGSTSFVAKGPASYGWEFSDGGTDTGAAVQHVFTSPGLQWAKLTVTDGDGDSASVTLNVSVQGADIIPRISASPGTSGPAPFTVDLDGSTSTVSRGPASYGWEFSDGGTDTGAAVQHVFTSPGAQWAKLTVTDADGKSASTTLNVTVQSGVIIPRISASPGTSGPAPFTVDLDGSTSTVSRGPASYGWEFSDGGTDTGAAVQHVFTSPGAQWAKLTVTDADGKSASTTLNVTVQSGDPTDADVVSVAFSGAIDYSAAGPLTSGDVRVITNGNRAVALVGAGSLDGPRGGSTRVGFNLHRLLFFDTWLGSISVSDPAAGLSQVVPYAGPLPRTGAPVKGVSNWAVFTGLPNLFSPLRLQWSVTDAG